MRGLNEQTDRDELLTARRISMLPADKGLDYRPERSAGENECGTD
jgi:hypothetical protein